MKIPQIEDDSHDEKVNKTSYFQFHPKQEKRNMSDVQQLSDFQEQVLAILPIPSAILSIGGSVIIIYIAIKQKRIKSWNPYTRLLVAMSSCDILFSITIAIATFLRPRETSSRVWAFGNDSTCSFVGFSQQLWSMSAILYNAMLSFYFLLTARFGTKNSTLSKCVEPAMHFLAIGYPLATATVGSALGVYGESAIALSCWVSNYKCDENGENCVSMIMAWFYYAIPVLGVFATLLINNVTIIMFVRRHTKGPRADTPISNRTEIGSTNSNISADDDENDDENCVFESSVESSRELTKSGSITKNEAVVCSKKERKKAKTQARRLRLVCTQSLLFVLCFFICNVWSGILSLAEAAAKTEEQELAMLVRFYPICILQSFFLPLQGFFNMIVYIRPRYILTRHEFPEESRIWTVQKVLFGDKHRPRPVGKMMVKINQERNQDMAGEIGAKKPLSIAEEAKVSEDELKMAQYTKRRRDMVSSLTASQGDFDHVIEANDDPERKWGEAKGEANATTISHPVRFKAMKSSVGMFSSLEVISELSVSVFDSITIEDSARYQHSTDGSQHQELCVSVYDSVTVENSELGLSPGVSSGKRSAGSRWDPSSRHCPRTIPLSDDSQPSDNSGNTSEPDGPAKAPVRKGSPPAARRPNLSNSVTMMVHGDSPLTPPQRWLSIPRLDAMDDVV